MAKIIKTNGEVLEVEPKNGTDFSLEEMQAIVGGYIEIVSLGDDLMVVNEEGKLIGLPINDVATAMITNDIIVGDVLICKNNQIK